MKMKIMKKVLLGALVSALLAVGITIAILEWQLAFIFKKPVLFLITFCYAFVPASVWVTINVIGLKVYQSEKEVFETSPEDGGKKRHMPIGIRLIPVFFVILASCFSCASYLVLDLRVKWYHMAARHGYDKAQYELGERYERGVGVEKNHAESAKWYRMAAEQGHAGAQFALGKLYDAGRGVEASKTEAVKWYRMAAEQGHAQAQHFLGFCYEHGVGIEQNKAEAVKWYRMAAEQGDFNAIIRLALCYQNGVGVVQNKEESEKWLSKVKWSMQQMLIGVLLYEGGGGFKQDKEEAVKWCRKAAEQGYAEAQLTLGLCYAKGEGIEQNKTEAVKWYRKAAEQGYAGAQLTLGLCYAKGEGIEQNKTEAVKWYRRAAAPDGKIIGGGCVAGRLDGKWYSSSDFLRAIASGDLWSGGRFSAEYALGICYRDGEGVPQDKAEAAKWLQKAAKHGHKDAQMALDELLK